MKRVTIRKEVHIFDKDEDTFDRHHSDYTYPLQMVILVEDEWEKLKVGSTIYFNCENMPDWEVLKIEEVT